MLTRIDNGGIANNLDKMCDKNNNNDKTIKAYWIVKHEVNER